VDLAGIGGSALTTAGSPYPEAPVNGIPVTYVPGAEHRCCCRWLWAGLKSWAADIFVGVNAVDYSGLSDSGRIHRAIRAPHPAGDQGRRRRRTFKIQAPLIAMSKRTSFAQAPTSRGLRHDRYLLSGGTTRACGKWRLLPPARRWIAGAATADPTRYR